MNASAFCTECGQPLAAAAKFCKNCGAPQESAATPAPPSPPVDEPTLVTPSAPPTVGAPTVTSPSHSPSPSPVAGAAAPSPPPPPPPGQAPPASPATPPPPSQGPEGPQAPGIGEQARIVGAQAAERFEQVNPGASDLAGELARSLATPAVAAAGIAALVTMGIMLAVAAVMALLPFQSSLFLFPHVGVVGETLSYAAAFTTAPYHAAGADGVGAYQTMPLLFALLPFGGMAVLTAMQSGRLRGLPPWQRISSGAAGALPLAILVLIGAVAGKIEFGDGGSYKVAAGSAFLLALLLGALGGAAGAGWSLRRERALNLGHLLPLRARPTLGAMAAALRALVVALGVATVIGLVVITAATLLDGGGVKGGRSAVGATIEDALYAPEHGVHMFELGSFVSFRFPGSEGVGGGGLPVPVNRVDKLVSTDSGGGSSNFRIFDYADTVPSWLFIIALLVLIAVPLLFALYGGFAAARAARAASPGLGAAWGAITGPVWAIGLAIINGLAFKTSQTPLWGHPNGGSVFGFSLLIGAVLGALGGLLATRSAQPDPSVPVA